MLVNLNNQRPGDSWVVGLFHFDVEAVPDETEPGLIKIPGRIRETGDPAYLSIVMWSAAEDVL